VTIFRLPFYLCLLVSFFGPDRHRPRIDKGFLGQPLHQRFALQPCIAPRTTRRERVFVPSKEATGRWPAYTQQNKVRLGADGRTRYAPFLASARCSCRYALRDKLPDTQSRAMVPHAYKTYRQSSTDFLRATGATGYPVVPEESKQRNRSRHHFNDDFHNSGQSRSFARRGLRPRCCCPPQCCRDVDRTISSLRRRCERLRYLCKSASHLEMLPCQSRCDRMLTVFSMIFMHRIMMIRITSTIRRHRVQILRVKACAPGREDNRVAGLTPRSVQAPAFPNHRFPDSGRTGRSPKSPMCRTSTKRFPF